MHSPKYGKVGMELVVLVRVHEKALNLEEKVLWWCMHCGENFFDGSAGTEVFRGPARELPNLWNPASWIYITVL
jgi:hypothetical protein